MNPEIMKGQIRSAIIAIGGVIAGWFAAKGWITTEQLSDIVTSPVMISVATMAAGFIWSAVTHTKKNAVAVVVEIAKDPTSPVRGVVTEPTSDGLEWASVIEGPVAVAGSLEAKSLAAHS